MDHYIVSARKYRPSTFGTVIGQKPLTAALKHAIATDRLAHAYLFCGSRGVGKTSCARIFAKTINCQCRTPQGEACNECASCQAFNNGTSLNIIELDAASHNGVDDIKALTDQVMVPPTQGRYRVFIIDEVHMLTTQAFNAFLKTLEEPPEYVIFILATTEKHKIIPTILSRCQIYDFNRITIQDMVEHLTHVAQNEGITSEPAALNVIARKADGAMRDALSIFDQVAASTMGNVTYQNTIANLNILDNTYYSRLVEAFVRNDVPTALLIYKEVREKGFDSQFFLNGLALYLRDLMVAMNPATIELLEASDDVRQQMAQVASWCTPRMLYAAMDLCNDADLNFRVATNKQFLVELTLVKIAQLTAPDTVQTPRSAPMKPITPAPQPAQGGAPAAPQAPATPQNTQAPVPGPAMSAPQNVPQANTAQAAPPQATVSQPIVPQPIVSQPAAPQYTPNPQPASPRKSGGLPTFSISGSRKEGAPQAAEAEVQRPRRNGEYTREQLLQVWSDFIAAHPTERILINTMKVALPAEVSPHSYVIEVDDQVQVEVVNQFKSEILGTLHDALQNDHINFSVAIRQGEASPVTWTQRQVLEHMIEKHPQFGEVISDFSLNL